MPGRHAASCRMVSQQGDPRIGLQLRGGSTPTRQFPEIAAKVLARRDEGGWQYAPRVDDTVHVRRERNRAAHELAQLAKRTTHFAVWRFTAPICVEQIIAQECNFISE